MKPLRILWIDDDEYLVDFCSRALRNYGAVVFVASTGTEGLAVLQDTEIDIIVSDLEMGEMDGLEVARRVEEMFTNTHRPKPKFVILTAWVKEMSPEEAYSEYKVNAILEKPIEIKTLFQTLNKMVNSDAGLNMALR